MHGGHLGLHSVVVSSGLELSLYQVPVASQELLLKMKWLSAEDLFSKPQGIV